MKKTIVLIASFFIFGCGSPETPEKFAAEHSIVTISAKASEQLGIAETSLEDETLVINLEYKLLSSKSFQDLTEILLLQCISDLNEIMQEEEVFKSVKTFKYNLYFPFQDKETYDDVYKKVLEFKVDKENLKGIKLMNMPLRDFIGKKMYDLKGDLDVKYTVNSMKF